MFKTKTAVITGIITLAVGVVLIIGNQVFTSERIVITGGLLFILAGILNTLVTLLAKDGTGKRKASVVSVIFNVIASAAAVAFGICLLVMKADFVSLINIMFAVLTLFGSAMLFYALAIGSRPVLVPGWLYVFPVLILGAAVAIYCLNGGTQDNIVMICTGAALIAFGLCCIIGGIIIGRQLKALPKADTAAAPAAPKPVEKPSPAAKPTVADEAKAAPHQIKDLD